ncbi:MAG: hypothetical protein U9Q79_09765 [Candidatus Hydrogenedentes bacterium]|nr:hypothetical protein [Candidatus Hydrogenedentota bacterium]
MTMFIRSTERKYKDTTYTNYLLVESVQTPKGPRQRSVCSLGDLKPRPRAEWPKLARKVEEALVGQGDLFEAADEEVQSIVAKVKASRAERASRAEVEDGSAIGILTDRVETEAHREIYRLLDMSTQIMKPRKTWTELPGPG